MTGNQANNAKLPQNLSALSFSDANHAKLSPNPMYPGQANYRAS